MAIALLLPIGRIRLFTVGLRAEFIRSIGRLAAKRTPQISSNRLVIAG
jgi:hypothetical protein